MTAFEQAWDVVKEDKWPERIGNLLGGDENELFGDTYEGAKEGKTEEEHDEFMEKVAELIDRLINPPPEDDPYVEAMKRLHQQGRIEDLTNEGIVPHNPALEEED